MKSRTVTGTPYFRSRRAAEAYYHPMFWSATKEEVARKIADGEIHIGKPPISTGAELVLIDNGQRWAVVERGK